MATSEQTAIDLTMPGRRLGRSEAKSIDDAEHGANIIEAMVRRQDRNARTQRSFRENMGRA
jgi:hypothetical protein